jgi:DNA-directed RNA polymerases I, II, and III subunit RPABC3
MTDFLSTTFSVTAIDPQGKKFEKVSRLQAKSSDLNILLELDYNNELIAISPGDEISFFLSFSDKDVESSYSYGMNGKIFKIEEDPNKLTSVYGSFGGLLMKLESAGEVFSKVKPNSNCKLYLKNKN